MFFWVGVNPAAIFVVVVSLLLALNIFLVFIPFNLTGSRLLVIVLLNLLVGVNVA